MPTKTQPIIEAKHITFFQGSSAILEDFSFQIESGSYVAILGPNGGGKTTLMRLILGLLQPEHGEIIVNGRCGYVPQRGGSIDATFPASVAEVVSAGLTETSLFASIFHKSNREHAIKKALQKTQMDEFITKPFSSLSGGQRQRVLLARALVNNPDILALDEPLDGLDTNSREELYKTLQQLHKQGTTILFVTHDVHRIAKEADAALCLRHALVCHDEDACLVTGNKLRNLYHASQKEMQEHHEHHKHGDHHDHHDQHI